MASPPAPAPGPPLPLAPPLAVSVPRLTRAQCRLSGQPLPAPQPLPTFTRHIAAGLPRDQRTGRFTRRIGVVTKRGLGSRNEPFFRGGTCTPEPSCTSEPIFV
jgi:hypothetical protein